MRPIYVRIDPGPKKVHVVVGWPDSRQEIQIVGRVLYEKYLERGEYASRTSVDDLLASVAEALLTYFGVVPDQDQLPFMERRSSR